MSSRSKGKHAPPSLPSRTPPCPLAPRLNRSQMHIYGQTKRHQRRWSWRAQGGRIRAHVNAPATSSTTSNLAGPIMALPLRILCGDCDVRLAMSISFQESRSRSRSMLSTTAFGREGPAYTMRTKSSNKVDGVEWCHNFWRSTLSALASVLEHPGVVFLSRMTLCD